MEPPNMHSLFDSALSLRRQLYPGIMPTTLTPKAEDTSIYECMVLLPTALSDKEENAAKKGIDGLFSDHKIEVLEKQEWEPRGLAYKIKGSTEAKYIVYYLEMAPAEVREFDRALRLEKGVLRHLVIKLEPGHEVVNYDERFRQWFDEQEKEEEEAEKEKEEELKRKIVKRAVKKPKKEEKPAEEVASKEEVGEKLDEKLEELISDEDLNL